MRRRARGGGDRHARFVCLRDHGRNGLRSQRLAEQVAAGLDGCAVRWVAARPRPPLLDRLLAQAHRPDAHAAAQQRIVGACICRAALFGLSHHEGATVHVASIAEGLHQGGVRDHVWGDTALSHLPHGVRGLVRAAAAREAVDEVCPAVRVRRQALLSRTVEELARALELLAFRTPRKVLVERDQPPLTLATIQTAAAAAAARRS